MGPHVADLVIEQGHALAEGVDALVGHCVALAAAVIEAADLGEYPVALGLFVVDLALDLRHLELFLGGLGQTVHAFSQIVKKCHDRFTPLRISHCAHFSQHMSL